MIYVRRGWNVIPSHHEDKNNTAEQSLINYNLYHRIITSFDGFNTDWSRFAGNNKINGFIYLFVSLRFLCVKRCPLFLATSRDEHRHDITWTLNNKACDILASDNTSVEPILAYLKTVISHSFNSVDYQTQDIPSNDYQHFQSLGVR